MQIIRAVHSGGQRGSCPHQQNYFSFLTECLTRNPVCIWEIPCGGLEVCGVCPRRQKILGTALIIIYNTATNKSQQLTFISAAHSTRFQRLASVYKIAVPCVRCWLSCLSLVVLRNSKCLVSCPLDYKLQGFNIIYCCFSNPICHKDDHYLFANYWTFG